MGTICLTEEQERLIPLLKKWYLDFYNTGEKKYFSLSGAAGTGKTTVIRYFIEDMGISLHDIICAAYVGKAVTVLATHGLPAKTIHALIYDVSWKNARDETGEVIRNRMGVAKLTRVFTRKKKLEWPYKLIIIDEASMVNDDLRDDILSFGIPVIFIGDMNQLPPIFGKSSVMIKPDFILTKIMRQAEGDPIIKLSQDVLHGRPLIPGEYGKSRVVTSLPRDEHFLFDYDIILTTNNNMREMINNFIRFNILHFKSTRPEIGDRIICRQNNWEVDLGEKGFYLTNGSAGSIMDLDPQSISDNSCNFEFLSDVTGQTKIMDMDYKYIQLPYTDRRFYGMSKFNKFEYGYAITTHLSQGSQYPKVLFIDEKFGSLDDRKKMRYTAITRAMESITILTAGSKY